MGQVDRLIAWGIALFSRTILAALLLLAAPAAAQTPDYAAIRAEESSQEAAALASATQTLCGRKLVLLGENGFHGDGRASAFKADLVRKLVADCGFDAVIFESSTFDFTAMNRAIRRGDASPDMLPSALGGLWNRNSEVQDLLAFLYAEVLGGRVVLAGMDDQLGARGAFYSLEAMPVELAGLLPIGGRDDCAARLRQRTLWRYTAAEPYDEEHRAALRLCLTEIGNSLETARLDDERDRADLRAMIAGFGRALERDFLGPGQSAWTRDRAMALNVEAIVAALPPGSKVVVWTANIHAARDASATDTFRDQPNMGALLRRRFGEDVVAVGVTAAGGAFRHISGAERAIDPATPDSLEARALTEPSVQVVWVDSAGLTSLSPSGGRVFDHPSMPTIWSEAFDAVLVFRAERPPYRLGG